MYIGIETRKGQRTHSTTIQSTRENTTVSYFKRDVNRNNAYPHVELVSKKCFTRTGKNGIHSSRTHMSLGMEDVATMLNAIARVGLSINAHGNVTSDGVLDELIKGATSASIKQAEVLRKDYADNHKPVTFHHIPIVNHQDS
jgi:hypothetical protein